MKTNTKIKTSKQLEPTEHQIQAAFFQWVQAMEQTDKRFKMIFAVPNGGVRHIGQAVKLKKEGVRSGVSDVIGLIPSGKYHGFCLEIKKPSGKVSGSQSEFLHYASMLGYLPAVAYSVEQCIEFTKNYLG